MIPLRYFGNKVLQYVFLKYASFGIQFLATLLIAYKLGPKEFGNWSNILLILQAFYMLNFGLPSAMSNQLSIYKQNRNYSELIFKNGIVLLTITILLITLFYFISLNSYCFPAELGKNIGTVWIVYLIILLYQVNNFYLPILRVYGNYRLINLYQLILPIFLFVSILIVEKYSIIALLLGQLCGQLILTALFVLNSPIKFGFYFSKRLGLFSVKNGISLFIHNSSYHAIPLLTRFFVSYYFVSEMFGYFSFAYSMSSVIILLLGSMSFLIHPKLLNRLSNLIPGDSGVLDSLRADYSTFANLLLHISILFYVLLVGLFTEYKATVGLFSILCMSQALFSMEFGFSTLLMAKNKNGVLAFITIASLLIHYIVLKIISLFSLNIILYCLSLMGTYTILTLAYFLMGRKFILKDDQRIWRYMVSDVFKLKLLFPIAINLLIVFADLNYYYYYLPLIAFLALNFRDLIRLIDRVKLILVDSSVVDL